MSASIPHLLVALLCADAPADHAPTVRDSIGVNIHFTGAPARDLDLIHDAGFGWVRTDLVWEAVEREKGAYLFGPYDELLDGLKSRAIGALLILDYSNPLYEKDRSVRTPEGRAAFARFASAAAGRYRGRNIRWEIWNEPDHETFWRPAPDPAEYAALALEAAKAIRAADPEAVILAPACSSFPWSFLESVFEKGLLEVIDEVSVHPYRATPPETVRDDYARLRDLIDKHSRRKPGPPIVSGEWGYSNHHWGRLLSEDLQAAYASRMFLTNMAYGVPLSIWYDWANDGDDRRNTEHNFGLVTSAREPKQAYHAARTLTTMVGKRPFARRLQVAQEDHVLLFGSGKEAPVIAAWTEDRPHALTLRLDRAGQARIVGMAGDESVVDSSENGSLSVPLHGFPTYVELPAKAMDLVVHGIDLAPAEDTLGVTVHRSGAGRRSGILDVAIGSSPSRHTVMLDATDIARVEVPVTWPIEPPLTVTAVLHDAETRERLAAAPRASFAAVHAFMEDWVQAAGNLRNFHVSIEGDPAVNGSAWVTRREGPEKGAPPGPRALTCTYRLERGGKYLRIAPVSRREVPGKPSALLVLVNGDSSGSRIRCRLKDSKDEVFQAEGVSVSWKGWKQVRLPLDGRESTHWGGDDDGVIDYPVTWDSLFLVEAPFSGSSGTLDFRFPLLVYPAE